MPLYKNTKTELIVEWSEQHHSKVGDRKYWELVKEKEPPKPKRKAVKKKAKK